MVSGAILLLVLAGCGDDAGNPFTTDANGSARFPATHHHDFERNRTGLLRSLGCRGDSAGGTACRGRRSLLGGPADESVSRALIATATTAAIDLTGVEITVWPVTGTGESLLIIEFDEAASAYADDEAQGGDLFAVLLASPLIDDRSITRVVIRMHGTDEQGPYIFTLPLPPRRCARTLRPERPSLRTSCSWRSRGGS